MNVSSNERDPGLNHGFAYVVDDEKFKNYLRIYDHIIPDEKSTCNNHDAIKLASMRGGKGTDASGMGTVECSRHDMKRANAVGDLQKGERYVFHLYNDCLARLSCTLAT
jgi:Kyakuja-Dileera-Zisupton transposase